MVNERRAVCPGSSRQRPAFTYGLEPCAGERATCPDTISYSEGSKTNAMKESWVYRRGDIYLANLNPFRGSEQGGKRPVLVLQNNTGNLHSSTIIVATMTSQTDKKKDQPTHYLLPPVGRLRVASVVQLEQIKTIDKCRVMEYFGRVPAEHMRAINKLIKISLGIIRIPKDYQIQEAETEEKHV